MSLLQRLFPDLSQPVHGEWTKDGLLLPDGSCLHWPEDDRGVVLRFAKDGELISEWWPGDPNYDALMNFFKIHPGPHDIVVKPFRVVGLDEDEQ